MVERNKYLRIKTIKKDNFICQKCKLEDKTGKKLEVHHAIPLYLGGKDNLENSITLCRSCHKYAPDHPEEFKEYMGEEMEGILSMLVNVWKKLGREHPELFKEDSFSKLEKEGKFFPKMENKELIRLRKENDVLRKEVERLKNLRKNPKEGMIKKATKGRLVSRAPWGYKIEKGTLLAGEHSHQVQELFEEFLNQKISLTKLAKKYGFSVNGLKKILTNFTYISKIKFNNQIFEGTHPPLLSSTLFNHVQNKLEKLGIKKS